MDHDPETRQNQSENQKYYNQWQSPRGLSSVLYSAAPLRGSYTRILKSGENVYADFFCIWNIPVRLQPKIITQINSVASTLQTW